MTIPHLALEFAFSDALPNLDVSICSILLGPGQRATFSLVSCTALPNDR